jgi:hypothetical protein
MLSFHLHLGLLSGLFPLGFRIIILCEFLISPCLLHGPLILLEFIALMLFGASHSGREVKAWEQSEHGDRGFESDFRHGCMSAFCVLCCPVQVQVLQRDKPPLKEFCQTYKRGFEKSWKFFSRPRLLAPRRRE